MEVNKAKSSKTLPTPSPQVRDDYLDSLYNNASKPGSFMGIEKLYDTVRRENIYNITYQEIRDWLQTNRTYSLYRRVRRVSRRPKVMVAGIDDQFDADLADLSKFASDNNGIHFLLVVIDIFTRFLWVRPLKNKLSTTVIKAFKDIFRKSKRKPRRIRSDRGSEFTAAETQHYFKTENIPQMFTANEVQANYVERAIQTLKTKIFRYMSTHDSFRYLDVLPQLVNSYNATYHKGIGAIPKDITKSDERQLWWNMYLPPAAQKRKGKVVFAFQKGDKVRISVLKKAFRREYDQKWSGEVFIIRRRFVRDRLPMYQIEDYSGEALKGTFYQNELQRIQVPNSSLFIVEDIVQRKSINGIPHVKVHFKDWPKKFDKWVKTSDLITLPSGQHKLKDEYRVLSSDE
jgi:hypothetical protein